MRKNKIQKEEEIPFPAIAYIIGDVRQEQTKQPEIKNNETTDKIDFYPTIVNTMLLTGLLS